MAYSRGRRSRQTSQRRKFVWARDNGTIAVPVAGPDTQTPYVNLLARFEELYGAQLLGATVMRIRGTIAWNTNAVSLAAATAAVVGCRVHTETPEGQASFREEGPLENGHADWFVYNTSVMWGGGDLQYAAHRYELDAKANRRFTELGQGLMLSANHSGSSVIDMTYFLSVGLKLP